MIIGYVRVSTQKQKLCGYGLDEQRKCISIYASTNNIIIDEWVQDIKSGESSDREGLNYILNLAQTGKLKTLIVYKIDRLARDSMLGEQIFRQLKALNVTIISTSEQFDDSINGSLMRQIFLAFAQYEKDLIKIRTQPVRKNVVRERGCFLGGVAPYGYRTKGSNKTGVNGKGELVKNEDEELIVKIVFKMDQEGFTSRQIATFLNNKGFKNRRGSSYQSMSIYNILKKRSFYAGQSHLNTSISLNPGVTPSHEKIDLF